MVFLEASKESQDGSDKVDIRVKDTSLLLVEYPLEPTVDTRTLLGPPFLYFHQWVLRHECL